MVKKLLINLLLLSLCIVSANAQVTVGATTPPADYAILQIEGVGGVRLPKLTLTERNALQATFTSQTEGVVIYLTALKPYIIFKVEANNKEHDEKGESIYFYELPKFKERTIK